MFHFSRRARVPGRVGAGLTIAALAVSLAQPLMLLAWPTAAYAGTPTSIFADDFEGGSLINWTSASALWSVIGADPHSNGKKAVVAGGAGEQILLLERSTLGLENISLTYWHKVATSSLEEADKVYVEYTADGVTWLELGRIEQGMETGEWEETILNLPTEANHNDNFGIRFRAVLDAAADEVRLDDVTILGEPLPPPATIAGSKYLDENKNGVQDEEPGLSGWELALYDLDNNQVATTSTDGEGFFAFTGLVADTYRVCEVIPVPLPSEPAWLQTEPAADQQIECPDGRRGYEVAVAAGGTVSEGIVFGNAELVVPATPILVSPVDGAVASTSALALTWSPGEGSDFEGPVVFELELRAGATSSDPIFASTTASTTLDLTGEALPGGLYFWWVRACEDTTDYENCSAWTDPWRFRGLTDGDDAAPRVEITSPANGEIVRGLVDIAGIIADDNPDRYSLSIIATGTTPAYSGGPGEVEQTISFDVETFLYAWETTSLPEGEYFIELGARDYFGRESTSSVAVMVDHDYIAPPILLSPVDGSLIATGTPLVSVWQVVPYAEEYRYELSSDPLFSSLVTSGTVVASSSYLVDSSLIDPSVMIPATSSVDYWWRVKAFDGNENESEWSSIWRVTVGEIATSTDPEPAKTETDNNDEGGISGGCYNCASISSTDGTIAKETIFGQGGDSPILAVEETGDQIVLPNDLAGGDLGGLMKEEDKATTSTSSTSILLGNPFVAAAGQLLLSWWWALFLIILAGLAGWWYWRKYRPEPPEPPQPSMF